MGSSTATSLMEAMMPSPPGDFKRGVSGGRKVRDERRKDGRQEGRGGEGTGGTT